MITEQRLDELEILGSCSQAELIRLARIGLKAESVGKEIAEAAQVAGVEDVQAYTKQMMLLGIWAEKAKQALESIAYLENPNASFESFWAALGTTTMSETVANDTITAREALAQLPKQGEE